jgi:hypothetical protein
MTVLSKISGAYTHTEYWKRSKVSAALNCIGDSCPAPGKSKVCKSVLPCPRKVESVQCSERNDANEFDLQSNRGHVACRVYLGVV